MRERHEPIEIKRPAEAIEHRRELAGFQQQGAGRDRVGHADGLLHGDGQARFLDRLAHPGDACGGNLGIDIGREAGGQQAIGLVHASAGKHRGAAGEAHLLGALDHQQLRRAARGAVAKDHHGGSRDDLGRGGDGGIGLHVHRGIVRRPGGRGKGKAAAETSAMVSIFLTDAAGLPAR